MAVKRTSSKSKPSPTVDRCDATDRHLGSLDALRELREQVPAVAKVGARAHWWLVDFSDPMQVAARYPFGEYWAPRRLANQPPEYIALLDRMVSLPYAKQAWDDFDAVVLRYRAPDRRRRDPGAMAEALFHELAFSWWKCQNEDISTDKERRTRARAILRRAEALRESLAGCPEFVEVAGLYLTPMGVMKSLPRDGAVAVAGVPDTIEPTDLEHILDRFIENVRRHLHVLDDRARFQGQPRTSRARQRHLARELASWFAKELEAPNDTIVGALTAAAFDLPSALPPGYVKTLRHGQMNSSLRKASKKTR